MKSNELLGNLVSKFKNIIPFCILFIAWFIFGGRVNPLFLPSMESVYKVTSDLLNNGVLLESLKMSFTRISLATCMSLFLSIPLGLLTVTFKTIEDIVTPITNLTRFIPVTAFYPLLIMWLGIDETMKVTFLFMATFFYFFPTVVITFKNVDKEIIEVAMTSGISKIKLMWKVYLPMCIPLLSQSFLMMYGIGWTYIIVAENINAKHGLGHLMLIGSARGNTSMVFAAIFVVIIISVLMDFLGNFMIRKAFKWHFQKE